jgi:cellulose synthase/poly-beta-1,6-N-acetylglucosamine synthase-like glycosyltransferase
VTLLLILLGTCFVYLLIAAYLSRGIHGHYQTRNDFPMVSVVVPVRNEEAQLHCLLDSLLTADYPAEKMEVIVVNDDSEDRTREIALSYKNRFACRYEVIDVVTVPGDKLILKTRPLAQGLDRATGEIVLMTDADCIVPSGWVKAMVSFFAPNVGMVCGTTLPHPEMQAKYPLTWFETLDWMFLLGASAGLSGKGHPQALIGNNYTVRREAYHGIGTFRGLEYTDIDDIALLMAIKQSGKWQVVFPANPEVRIFTRPLQSIAELARQRRRWMKGFRYTNWQGKAVIIFGTITHVTMPLWPFYLGWEFLLPFTFLMLGDGMVLGKMLRQYRLKRLMILVPMYPIFACMYGLGIMYFLAASRRVPWKGRTF